MTSLLPRQYSAPFSPHTSSSPRRRRTASSRPSMTAHGSIKRARHESPARDWQDLSSSYGSLYSGAGPSPGFFVEGGASPAPFRTPGATSQAYFPPNPNSHALANDMASPGLASPSSLANSRYQLAGGQTTPSLTQSATSDFFSQAYPRCLEDTSDLGFRRGRPYYDARNASRSTLSAGGLHSEEERLPTALSRESNGRPRALPSNSGYSLEQSGLGRSVLQSVTGIVGRVLDFCTAGTFRGFFAGGGTGYSMQVSSDFENRTGPQLAVSTTTASNSIWQEMDNSSAHVPGGFPSEPDFCMGSAASTQIAKKTKLWHDTDEAALSEAPNYPNSLTQSWIMVRDQHAPGAGGVAAVTANSQPSSPERRKIPFSPSSHASPASMRQTPSRPSLRRSSVSKATTASAAQTRPASATSRPASAAGLRSPARSPMHSRQSSQVNICHKKRASEAFVTSPGIEDFDSPRTLDSPIARETARFIKDLKKKERREDRNLFRMNCALEDMIREAQEALGTTVEVEMLGEGRDVDRW